MKTSGSEVAGINVKVKSKHESEMDKYQHNGHSKQAN